MADKATQTVAVIGSGTMGAGIAQVAVQRGFSVRLYDANPAVLERACEGIAARLVRLVEKGHLTAAQGEAAKLRLQAETRLEDLADAHLIIEAVPERMEIKRELFTALDSLCNPDTLLASNTSSLSLTALAAPLQHPQRVIGLHFFNPAPLMQLVEVVVGEDTNQATLEQALTWVREFAKHPIVCRDTPGFVVNRVARNFYGEALRLVAEGTAGTAQVDVLVRQGLGFPVGPFELMDLIGIDVNFDVTQSIYHAFYEEPRFRPHPLQAQMVATGRLGKKTGRGFYRYDDSGKRLEDTIAVAANNPDGETIDLTMGRDERDVQQLLVDAVVVGDTPLASALRARLAEVQGVVETECGLVYSHETLTGDSVAMRWREEVLESFVRGHQAHLVVASFAGDGQYVGKLLRAVERGARDDTVLLTSLAGPSATELAAWLVQPSVLRGFGLSLPLRPLGGELQAWEWTRPLQCLKQDLEQGLSAKAKRVDDVTQGFIRALGGEPHAIRDGAGGVQLRILSMLCSEACEVLRAGTASLEDVDLGMRLGTNWPQGPFAWLQVVGVPVVYHTLAAVWREQGEDRYRPSPLLRQMVLAGEWDLSALHGGDPISC